ncbi:hypothetical protein [Methylobacterium radiodurans]|uniref:ribonuclease toxin HepT-like protein n=1 Tax=Methylobacterium radiodurans TaxID=2202828 RepID=UPI001FE61169|nr:hypothetical protein [Methylobacterium radiodurans]
MIASSHPAFAKLGPKLERAAREFRNLDTFPAQYDALPPEAVNAWGRMTATAGAVHNVYNGIEDTLLSLANDIDGTVPTGETSHQDLLDQMRAAVVGLRPPLLDDALYLSLTELKGFGAGSGTATGSTSIRPGPTKVLRGCGRPSRPMSWPCVRWSAPSPVIPVSHPAQRRHEPPALTRPAPLP